MGLAAAIPIDRTAVILGGGSLVAAPLIDRLAATGYRVQVLGRERPACLPADRPGVAWRRFDAGQPGQWVPPAGAAVFSLLPLWFLPRLLPRMVLVRHLVAFSSTSVTAYAASPDPGERRLARRLEEGEQAVRSGAASRGLACTILRPTIIYGGGSESGLSGIVRWIDHFGVVPVAAPAHGLRQPVHAADLAAAAAAVVDHPAAAGHTFALGGGEVLRFRRMVELLIAGSGRSGRVVAAPPAMLKLAFAAAARLGLHGGSAGAIGRMNADQSFSIEPARRAFGYAPRGFQPRPADFPPVRPAPAALRPLLAAPWLRLR